MIDLDSLIPGSKYFRWREILWCPKWSIHVYPTPEQHGNLIHLAQKMDEIRDLFKKPIQVSSGLRPSVYNELIGGSKASQHCLGKACDFSIFTMSIDEIHAVLEPRLEPLGIRMEKGTSTWVHIDIANVMPGGSRYFLP